jgi:hypothetical protein
VWLCARAVENSAAADDEIKTGVHGACSVVCDEERLSVMVDEVNAVPARVGPDRSAPPKAHLIVVPLARTDRPAQIRVGTLPPPPLTNPATNGFDVAGHGSPNLRFQSRD